MLQGIHTEVLPGRNFAAVIVFGDASNNVRVHEDLHCRNPHSYSQRFPVEMLHRYRHGHHKELVIKA